MKKFSSLLFVALASLVMASGVFAQATPKISKYILLRSKEQKTYTVAEEVEKKTDNGRSVTYHYVEKPVYEEIFFKWIMSYTEEAKSFLNNKYLQEDLVWYMSDTHKHNDSLIVQVLNQIKGAKTVDEALDKLCKIDGYNAFVMDEDSFNAEAWRNSDNRKVYATKDVKISVTNGIVKVEIANGWGIGSSNFSELYDFESGKRIQPSDLLSNIHLPDNGDERSKTVVKIKSIQKDKIVYEATYVVERRDEFNFKKDDSLLTDYAKSLMAKDKGYTKSIEKNAFGDKIQKYHFEGVNGGYKRIDVMIPLELKGCANTKNIRNRMLDVMFGRHVGDMDALVAEGVGKWVPEDGYGSGKEMLLKVGDGLVSFGFEDQSASNNSKNVFIVFDKKTGKEISAKELIKDKDGFMKFVNSHNLYMAGYLVDTTKIEEQSKKFGPEFKSYLRHSGGMWPFPGLEEFPTSWWFAFNKMDEIVPVEFNTSKSRIFLDYADIKKYINPKYLKVMESAVKPFMKEYGSLTDARDNQTYKTIIIGSQTWMAENLNYNYNKGSAKSFCYNNDEHNCNKYGRLYQWSAAMDSAAVFSDAGKGCGSGKKCSPSGTVRGVCPEGWHLPNKAELEKIKTLAEHNAKNEAAGAVLKSKDVGGSNELGFAALPAGWFQGSTGEFRAVQKDAYYWSITEFDEEKAAYMYLGYSDGNYGITNNYKNIGFSVRCVKD